MRCGLALFFLAGALAAQTPQPEPQGAIRGVVKDSLGAPMPDVSVTAAPSRFGSGAPIALRAPQSSTTDEAGSYVLTGLPSGTYSVSVVRNRAANASRQVKLDSGQEIAVDFVIPADPTISGRVLQQNC
jgi:hypothetical protein